MRKLARMLMNFGHHALEFMVSVRPEAVDDFHFYIQLTIERVSSKLLAHDPIGPIAIKGYAREWLDQNAHAGVLFLYHLVVAEVQHLDQGDLHDHRRDRAQAVLRSNVQ